MSAPHRRLDDADSRELAMASASRPTSLASASTATSFETVTIPLSQFGEGDRLVGPQGELTLRLFRPDPKGTKPGTKPLDASFIVRLAQNQGTKEVSSVVARGPANRGYISSAFGMSGRSVLTFDTNKETRFLVTMTKVVNKAEQEFESVIELNELIVGAMNRAGIQPDGTRKDSKLEDKQPLWQFSGYELTLNPDIASGMPAANPQLELKFDAPSMLSRFNPMGASEQTVFFTATRSQERPPAGGSRSGSPAPAPGAPQIDEARVNAVIVNGFGSLEKFHGADAAAIAEQVRALSEFIQGTLRSQLDDIKPSADTDEARADADQRRADMEVEIAHHEAALQQMQASQAMKEEAARLALLSSSSSSAAPAGGRPQLPRRRRMADKDDVAIPGAKGAPSATPAAPAANAATGRLAAGTEGEGDEFAAFDSAPASGPASGRSSVASTSAAPFEDEEEFDLETLPNEELFAAVLDACDGLDDQAKHQAAARSFEAGLNSEDADKVAAARAGLIALYNEVNALAASESEEEEMSVAQWFLGLQAEFHDQPERLQAIQAFNARLHNEDLEVSQQAEGELAALVQGWRKDDAEGEIATV